MADHANRGVQLKSPPALPCLPEPFKVRFLHPHYPDRDALFRLPRLDATQGSSVPSGVHHHTALLACQIVANNAFRGYLATDRDGEARVTVGQDDILTHDKYWFIADPSNPRGNYPVVPRFEDWIFPNEEFLGLRWRPDRLQRPPDQSDPPTDAPMLPPTATQTPPAIAAQMAPPPYQNTSLAMSPETLPAEGDSMSSEKVDGDVLKKEYNGGGIIRSSAASSNSRKRSYSLANQGADAHYDRLKVYQWIQDPADDDPEESQSIKDAEWNSQDLDFDTDAERGRGRPRKRRCTSPGREQTLDTLPSLVTDDNVSLDAHGPTTVTRQLVENRYTLPPVTSAKNAVGNFALDHMLNSDTFQKHFLARNAAVVLWALHLATWAESHSAS
ncbi:hypothetical protein DHEL01_v207930 [Diaporthe helianthi]|uniref:Uncharacterized protein n=1 Tax=Diaporthe helianthi TaxID=158607 RepID=A0A2P5HTV7_DIAHE|nr:hypothetical protein DHEL01_v207930 [Diaporthe helianthi]